MVAGTAPWRACGLRPGARFSLADVILRVPRYKDVLRITLIDRCISEEERAMLDSVRGWNLTATITHDYAATANLTAVVTPVSCR